DARRWVAVRVNNGAFSWTQPIDAAGQDRRHVDVYMSAHKHHQYFGTSNDEQDSAYSDFGCNDDVNGRGAQVFPALFGEVCRSLGQAGGVNKVGCRDLAHNVGEPSAHDEDWFVDSLDGWYQGEKAWSGKAFKGGLGDDGGETSSLREMWSTAAFEQGPRFAMYLPAERVVTGIELPLSSLPIFILPCPQGEFRAGA